MNTNKRSRYLSAAVSAVLSFAAATANAGPQNGTVTSGAATISTPASSITQIDQTTNSVSIDWQSFDVAANEHVNFNQPSTGSVALNRILTQDPSQILGSINANGRVFLLNPNGIIFGASARVNVGSLVATSLDLTDADAANGRYSFGTSATQAGAIVNNGTLTAANGGSITLLGGSVLNTGLIVADYGTVNLGAGRAATLSFDADGLMRFQIDAGLLTDSSGAQAAVDNTGQIIADGGQVLLTAQQAGDVVARAVNNDGVVRAARIDNTGGVIRLVGSGGTVVNSGMLDATGTNGTGGEIAVLGEHVALTGTAVLDATGTHGGGTALVGGGFAGADPALLNAQSTTVDAGAVIRADSTESGDAGRIAVWADDTTTFNGQVLARASGASGDGGFIEVSGKRYLTMGGSASTISANGVMGTLLLDPGSVRIIDGNVGANASPNVFTDGWLNNQLDSSSVTIQTSAADTGPETIAIEEDVAISWDGIATLTLEAGESITMDASSSITNTERANGGGAGVGNLQMSAGLLGGAGGSITLDGTISVAGDVDLSAAGTAGAITTTGAITADGTATLNAASTAALGSITAGALSVTAGGDISQTAAFDISGTSTFSAAGQDVVLDEGNEFTGAVSITAGSASLTADAAVNLGGSTVTNALSLTTTAGGITQTGVVNAGSTVFDAAGNVAVNSTLNAGNSLTITAGGPITQIGAITTSGLANFTTRNDAGASIMLGGTNSFGSVAASVRNAANTANATAGITIAEANDTQLAGNLRTAAGQTVSITSAGNITQTGAALTAAGNVSLTAGGATRSITLESANAVSGSIGFDAANVSFVNAGNTALRASDVTGTLTVESAGVITQTGDLTVGGNASFTAGANQSITLGADNTFDGDVTFASTGTLGSVTVVDTTALTLQPMTLAGNLTATGASISTGAITVDGDLALTATTGGINQTGALEVGGSSTFTAAAGQSILLGQDNVFIGAVSFVGDGGNLDDVTIRDLSDLNLSTMTIGGDLTVNAASVTSQALTVGGALDFTATAGDISQTGAFTVNQASTFRAPVGRSILLGQANTFHGSVAFIGNGGSLNDVTVRDTTALDLSALTITGDLNATGAFLSQTGALNIGQSATFTANQGSTLFFDNPNNAFQGTVRFASNGPGALQGVTLVNSVATELGATAVNGAFNVTAISGSITQSGALNVGGAATFTAATGQSINVGNAGNTFDGTVSFSGAGGNLANVTVRDSNALTLQALTVDNDLTATAASIDAQGLVVGRDLNLTASTGDITQSAAMNVTRDSTFTANAGQSITLGEANTFTGAVAFVGDGGNLANVTVHDTTSLTLQTLNVSGDLTATAADVTAQALIVGGDLALTATSGDIAQTAAMNVTGNSTFTAAAGQSVALGQANTFTGSVTFTGSGGNLANVTVRDSNALTLQTLAVDNDLTTTAASIDAQQLTVGGNLNLTATTGDITQTDAMNVTGNSTFTADAGRSILLGQANTFTGTVSFVGDGGNLDNVTLSNSNTIDLQALALDGDLIVTSTGGAITQSGELDIGGTSTFTAAAGQSVSLADTDNDFTGTVTFLGSGGNLANVEVYDVSALTLGALTITGDLSVNAASIAQTGALTIGGSSSFTASGGQSVDLDNPANVFTGTVGFAARSGMLQDVSVADTTALDLQALTIGGNLAASGASLTQSGALSVGGTAALTSGAGIDLNTLTAGALTVNAADAITQSGTLSVGGTATLTSGAGVGLNTLTAGALTVSAAGAVTQTGALDIAGNLTVNASGQSIVLGNTNNAIDGAIAVTADSAILLNSAATTLAASTLGTSLVVGSTGAITQTGALNVAGGSTILASAAGVNLNAIDTGTLTIGAGGNVTQSAGALNVTGDTSIDAAGQTVALNAGNTFGGSIALTAADASLTNAGATTLGASTIANDLTVVSTGALSQSAPVSVGGDATLTAAGVTFDNFSAGTLTVNSSAAIGQTGALNIAGDSTFNAAGQSVTLTNAGNTLNGGIAITAATAALNNATATTLRASTLSDSLTVTSTGLIAQTGALDVTGAATLSSGAGVSLDTLTADSLTVSASGAIMQTGAVDVTGAATLTSGAGVSLDTLTADSLTVSASGAITQTGALDVAGAATLTSGAGVSLNALTADSLTVSAGGAIAQTGTLDVTGAATLASGAGVALDTLTADSLTVSASGAITQTGTLDVTGAATLTSGAGVALDTLTADSLTVSAGGAVTQTDTLNVSGTTTIAAAGQTVALGNANQFGGGIAVTGADVTLADADSIDLRASTVSGNLAVAALSGTITQSGALNVTGNSTFTAADGQSISLTDAGNTFSGVQFASSGRLDDVTLAAASGVDLQVLDIAGDLAVTSGGSLTQSGTLIVDGAADFSTINAGGNITLAGANQFGSIGADSQGSISITEGSGDMNVRQVVATGPVRLEATGGAIVADATTSISGGGVELRALSNIGNVTDLRTRQGVAVAVNPGSGALSAHVADANGQINLALASGSAPSAAPDSITAGGNGRLLIQSTGDLSLDAFDSAVAGFTEVGFSADGTLSIPGGQSDLLATTPEILYLRGGNDITRADRTFNLSADTLIFESGGQGGSATLNTNVSTLDANIGNGASLTVVEANDLVLGTITAGGNLSITAGNLQDDGDANGVTRVTAANSVSLNGAAGVGSATNRIDTAGQSVSVQSASGAVFVSHAGDVQLSGSAGGAIDVETTTGSITVVSSLQATGPLTLTAGSATQAGNIVLSGTAGSAGAATLTALGGGAISDSDDASVHLNAQDLTLSARAIGSQASRLSIDAVSLTATSDSIHVQDANALQLRSIAGQTVAIGAVGALTDDGDNATRVSAQMLTLAGASIGAASNEIDINAGTLSASTSAGGIFISEQDDVQLASIGAAGGDVALTAAGAIIDDGDDATRISGNQLTLTAASIGAAGVEVDTQVASLSATASAGGVYLNEADDLQLNAISGTDVAITAAGALTDDGNDATRVTGNTVRLAGTRLGANDNRIDTAATSLTMLAANGGIYFAEADDVALDEVRSSGTGNTVDGLTAANGSMTVQTLVTQGGAVNLTAGGTGSITVTGAIESNNGVVNLTSGNALALPGLDTGTGSVVLHTVNDLNVGTITSGSVSITSDTGNVMLGTINAAGGTVTITANNGAITDGTDTSLTAGQATLSARQIGGPDQALNVEVDTLTATASGGGIYINDSGTLTLGTITAAGDINLVTTGLVTQTAGITSGGHDIVVVGGGIGMQAGTTTTSGGGDITYIANDGNATLSVVDAAGGRALVIASDNVYSALAANSGINNLTASAVEVRAGGLGGSLGEIGTLDAPISISTSGGAAQSVYLIVPALNGIQTSTPSISYAGSSGSLLLKGYTGSTGVLLFDLSSTFSPETILSGDETIVPLRNGRVAVNSDSLAAAKQALSSGVVARINVDWAAFDPNVSLFGTLDPALRLPADQIDEAAPAATLIPEGTVLMVSRDGWRLKPST